jgi:Calpain family cysteine protease
LQDSGDAPDITQTAWGDPAKPAAQITGKTPYYYNTDSRTAEELYIVVRSHSVSYKTLAPMTAWTFASGPSYDGTNVVANHAYTVLGWAWQNSKQHIVLRNPWGLTEPAGMNTYQGLLSFFDDSFWRPINTIGDDGVFALEAPAFKYYFACLGVAK